MLRQPRSLLPEILATGKYRHIEGRAKLTGGERMVYAYLVSSHGMLHSLVGSKVDSVRGPWRWTISIEAWLGAQRGAESIMLTYLLLPQH